MELLEKGKNTNLGAKERRSASNEFTLNKREEQVLRQQDLLSIFRGQGPRGKGLGKKKKFLSPKTKEKQTIINVGISEKPE